MNKIIFGIGFSFFWSSAFIAGKYSLDYLSPLSFLSLRFLLAGILLLGLYSLLAKHRIVSANTNNSINSTIDEKKIFSKSMWRDAIVLGLLNYALYLGMSYSGLQYLSPELVVLLVSTTPFLTAFAQSYMSKSWSLYLWTALILGFTGVGVVLIARMGGIGSLLVQLQNPTEADSLIVGVIWVLLSVIALASGTLYYQIVAFRHNAVVLTGLQNLCAGVVLLPFISLVAWRQALLAPIFLGALLYQVVLVSGVAMLMWLQLIRWFGSGYAAAFHLLNPIFATILSIWLFDLNLSLSDVIGTAMVVVAMGIISIDLTKQKY